MLNARKLNSDRKLRLLSCSSIPRHHLALIVFQVTSLPGNPTTNFFQFPSSICLKVDFFLRFLSDLPHLIVKLAKEGKARAFLLKLVVFFSFYSFDSFLPPFRSAVMARDLLRLSALSSSLNRRQMLAQRQFSEWDVSEKWWWNKDWFISGNWGGCCHHPSRLIQRLKIRDIFFVSR